MKPPYLVFLLATAGCAAPAKFATGNYVEIHGPKVIALTGRTLRLNPDQTFTYAYWSDDLASSRYGTGSYQFARQKLKLVFGPTLPTEVPTRVVTGAVQPDSLTLTFLVKCAESPAAPVPLVGATVLARSATGQLVAGASCDAAGRATLRLARGARPATLLVSNVGFRTWQQACPTGNAAYELQLPADAGTAYEAGTVKEFRVRHQRRKRLVLAQGKQVLTLVAQPIR